MRDLLVGVAALLLLMFAVMACAGPPKTRGSDGLRESFTNASYTCGLCAEAIAADAAPSYESAEVATTECVLATIAPAIYETPNVWCGAAVVLGSLGLVPWDSMPISCELIPIPPTAALFSRAGGLRGPPRSERVR